MLMGELGSWCWPAGQEDRRAFCPRAKEGGYILKPKSLVRDGKPCSWLSLSHRYSRQVAGAGGDAGPVEQQRSPWGFQLIRKTSSSLPSLAPPCALTLSLQPPPQTRLRARPGRAPGCAGALVGVSLPGHCGPPPPPQQGQRPSRWPPAHLAMGLSQHFALSSFPSSAPRVASITSEGSHQSQPLLGGVKPPVACS